MTGRLTHLSDRLGWALFEDCIGCYEHVDTARLFKDHDGAGRYIRRSDFLVKFRGLEPFHPDSETDLDGDRDGD